MTDLRTRLADALRVHLLVCGVPESDLSEAQTYLSHVLLSLPGITIVELPPANSTGRWSLSARNDLWAERGEVVQVLPQSSGATWALRSPETTRKLAAALLAAANAAEGA